MVPVRGVECAAAELFAAVDRRIGRSMQLADRRYQDVGLRAFAVAEFEMPDAVRLVEHGAAQRLRSEEHTSELQSLMRISYAAFCLKKKHKQTYTNQTSSNTH